MARMRRSPRKANHNSKIAGAYGAANVTVTLLYPNRASRLCSIFSVLSRALVQATLAGRLGDPLLGQLVHVLLLVRVAAERVADPGEQPALFGHHVTAFHVQRGGRLLRRRQLDLHRCRRYLVPAARPAVHRLHRAPGADAKRVARDLGVVVALTRHTA